MIEQDKTYYVYKHTNKYNNKVYIGITCREPYVRWNHGRGYEKNDHFWRSIQKYGWNDGFSHEIVAAGLSKADACELEIELIKMYDSTNPDHGYNISSGGECGNAGCYYSDEWLQKMRDALNKPVICVETSAVYKSEKIAQQETGIRASSIGPACRGDYGHKTAGGFHWVFWDINWDNFKLKCKELGVECTRCERCGVLIAQGNSGRKKYCTNCSGRISSPIKLKVTQVPSAHHASDANKGAKQIKRPMGKRKNVQSSSQ